MWVVVNLMNNVEYPEVFDNANVYIIERSDDCIIGVYANGVVDAPNRVNPEMGCPIASIGRWISSIALRDMVLKNHGLNWEDLPDPPEQE